MRIVPWIGVVCLFVSAAMAEDGASDVTGLAGTSTYEFEARESTITQTGGFAGVHRVHYLRGLLVLTVDPNVGIASFDRVEARAADEGPFGHDLDPNDVFNMTGLAGTVAEDGSIRFEGRAGDGSSVLITLVATEAAIHLRGETVPPPQSADFFVYELDATAHRRYAGGTGEPNNPYLIGTAEQLNALGAEPNDWDKHFRLMADVDLAGRARTEFDTIGYFRTPRHCQAFTGVFDGNGHRVLNLAYRSGVDNAAGLFGYVDGVGAEIRDVVLVDPNIDAPGADLVGTLVGYLQQGTIRNCHAIAGHVSGHFEVGGLVGFCAHGTIVDSSADGDVRGTSGVGGLVGDCEYGMVLRCRSAGTVAGHDAAGGLVGGAFFFVTITDCCSNAGVRGNLYVGGLAGSVLYGTVANCYSTGAVSGEMLCGGLVGFRGNMITGPSANVTTSFWDIDASGQPASDGGTGVATAQMQTADTFLAAGWDFVGEAANGTQDVWWMPDGQGYPRLAWEQSPHDANVQRASDTQISSE